MIASIPSLCPLHSTPSTSNTRTMSLKITGMPIGPIGYGLMASFNNPLLFIQVSAIVFVGIGYGLAISVSSKIAPPPADVTGNADAQRP